MHTLIDFIYVCIIGLTVIIWLPLFLIPAFLHVLGIAVIFHYYQGVVQDFRRHESAMKSPLIGYVREAFAGRVTIRAYACLEDVHVKAVKLITDYLYCSLYVLYYLQTKMSHFHQ